MMTNTPDQLDRYLSPAVRATIDQRYYARINAQSQLSQALNDPIFLPNLSGHTALISDHGVVHVRDVAQQILQVLEAINGVLISERPADRLEWMKGYGVMVAYVHDIGMIDFSAFGRVMHPEYATQAVFGLEFDDIFDALVQSDNGQLIGRLARLEQAGALDQTPQIVLREMLGMANCHSKSKIPVKTLNDFKELRDAMQLTAITDLHYLYCQHEVQKARRALTAAQQEQSDQAEIDRFASAFQATEAALETAARSGSVSRSRQKWLRQVYVDFEHDAFRWLESQHPDVQQLALDVIDTLRALRCADALRQRGTVLKTSGEYEVFVDQHTANAIYALRHDDDRLFLLEISEYLSAGEANIASGELGQDGNLRISFHRGRFGSPDTTQYAAYCAALVVNDVQMDVIGSFQQAAAHNDGGLSHSKAADDIQILLEAVDDNLEFAELVRHKLVQINPLAASRTRTVPSLQNTSAQERARYLAADELDWDIARRRAVLDRISASGHKTQAIDLVEGFQDVKSIELSAGETLIEAGSPAGFVYIPLGEGLQIIPLGGYQAFFVRAWIPLGITGVIRGAARNATVVATQDLSLLMIPKDVYLKHWHHTYSPQEFAQLFAHERPISTLPAQTSDP